MADRVRTVPDRIRNRVEQAAALFLALVALVTFAGAGARYVIKGGLPDAYEFVQMLLGVAVLWGIALATFDDRHITFDILYERLPARWRARFDLLATVITTGFLACAFYMSLHRALETVSNGLTTTQLGVPVWPLWLLAVLGLGAAVLMAVFRLGLLFKAMVSHDQ